MLLMDFSTFLCSLTSSQSIHGGGQEEGSNLLSRDVASCGSAALNSHRTQMRPIWMPPQQGLPAQDTCSPTTAFRPSVQIQRANLKPFQATKLCACHVRTTHHSQRLWLAMGLPSSGEVLKIVAPRLPFLQLYQLRRTCRSLKWACQGVKARLHGKIQQALLDIFQRARDAENMAESWYDMSQIREQAKSILSLIEVSQHELQDPDDPVEITGSLEEMLHDIDTKAYSAAMTELSRADLCRAARWLIRATREVERLLGLRPEIGTQEVSGDLDEAATMDPPVDRAGIAWDRQTDFTAPTSVPRGTGLQESVTDSKAIIEEAADLPEVVPGGDLLAQQQRLEHQLLEVRSEGSGESMRAMAILHQLGGVTAQLGNLKLAMQHFQESLQMQRSLHGEGDHPGIAATLNQLGKVKVQLGEEEEAMHYLEQSLRIQRSLHGDGDNPGIAETLNELGVVTAQTGNLEQAMQHFEESLRMQRSLHGDVDHPGIATTLNELGDVFTQLGNLNQAMEYLQESLRMKRSLHGDKEHAGISVALHQLGCVASEVGNLQLAMCYLEESLRMERALHGDNDHPSVAATLHELGRVALRTKDYQKAIKYLQEALCMERHLHKDHDNPGKGDTLQEVAKDLKHAMRYLEGSRGRQQSPQSDSDHPDPDSLPELDRPTLDVARRPRSKGKGRGGSA
eukprot:s2104_g4.t1